MLLAPLPSSDVRIVVIGMSLGGGRALRSVLSILPSSFPVPIVVAQHLGGGSSHLPALLNRTSALRAEHAVSGEVLRAGHVTIGPPSHHVLLDASGRCELSPPVRDRYARPSVDALFATTAEAYGPSALAVVLSGKLHDGEVGSLLIRRAGGVVIAQSPDSCEADGMPNAAIRAGADFVLPPLQIGRALISLTMMPGVSAMFGVGRYRAA